MNTRLTLLCALVAGTAGCAGTAQPSESHELVRLLLTTISLDSLCSCQDVVIDPIVRRVGRGFIAPPARADTLVRLEAEDLRMIRGARSVTTVDLAQWPYFARAPQDTLALAIYAVDSVPSVTDQKFFALLVIPPGGSMRGWSWTASRHDGMWRGGPMVLYYEP